MKEQIPVFTVINVAEKQNKKREQHGLVELTGDGLHGDCKIRLAVAVDDAQEYQVGETYKLALKQVRIGQDGEVAEVNQ